MGGYDTDRFPFRNIYIYMGNWCVYCAKHTQRMVIIAGCF
jgi:hypothetical protein